MKKLICLFFLVAVLVVVVQPPGAHVYGKNVATHQLTTWCLQNSKTLVANNIAAGDENSNFNVFTSKLNIGTITVPLVSININANCTNLFIDRGSTVASQNFNLVVRKENRSVMQTLNTRVYYNLKKPINFSSEIIMTADQKRNAISLSQDCGNIAMQNNQQEIITASINGFNAFTFNSNLS